MAAGIRGEVDLSVNVNTTNAKRSMEKAADQLNKIMGGVGGRGANFKVNERSFTQPLGRITGSANEFNKSLEASNARVIAFGASVGIINGVSNAFKNLVAETVKFEKVLADVNVVLNASNDSLQRFGSGLFDVAKNTAQSFTTAATAALEFSRQGLSMNEVLKRTNDALTLTRLTSLKAEEAVSGLTAAVNAFGNAGLTTTDIVDKLAAVDVKFAVSSEDLIKALERTGAVAIDAGVEIDSLIGLVAALQQTTARGGAVIGNGLKTIFTRIQRPESLRQLENMDMVVRDLSGAVLSADKILLNIAKNFDKLTQAQQSNVVQFSAGIFQANVFRASLRDLAKEQSLQQKATEISAGAAGEAAIKNKQLNKTISALASQSLTAIQELAGVLGDLMIKPEISGFLDLIKEGVEGLTNMLGGGEEQGSSFAKGIVRGIGNIITGPGAIAFGAVFIKLFANVAKFARTSLQDVLGMVTKKERIQQTEESILSTLSSNHKIQQSLNDLAGDQLAQENFILKVIEAQNNAMREQQALAQRLAPSVVRAGISPDLTATKGGVNPVDLDGDGKADSFGSQGVLPSSAKRERKEALRGGYMAGAVDSMSIKGLGRVVFNKAETVKQFPGMQQEAIMPPEKSRAGSRYREEFKDKHGFDPYAAEGFIPNFARLNGSELILSQAKMQLHGMPRSAKTTQALRDKMVKGEMTGSPVDVSANISSLIGTGEGSHTKKIKDVLQFLSQHGVESITRPFKITKLPRMRGAITPQKTEEAVMKSLQKEGGKFRSSGGRDGDDSFPIDLFGLGLTPREVKSGEWNLPNLIMKSLRLYNDDELLGFAQSRFGASKEMIQGARSQNLEKSARLLRKKGILKENASDEEVMKAVREHGLGRGFVPSFADKKKTTTKDWEKIIDILSEAKSGEFSGARGAAAYLKEKNPANKRLQASDSMITYHLIQGSRKQGKKKSSLYEEFTSKPRINKKIQKIKQSFGGPKESDQDRSFLPGSIKWERMEKMTKRATLNDIAKHRGGFSLQGKGDNRNPGMAFVDTAIGSTKANGKIKEWGGMISLRKKIGNPSYSLGISRYIPYQGENPLTTKDLEKAGIDDGPSFERFIKRSAGVLAGAETAEKAPLDFLNKDGEAKFVPYSGGGKNFSWVEIVGKGVRSKIGNNKSNFNTPEAFRNSLAHGGNISPINLFQAAAGGFIPNFATTSLFRGTSPRYQKAIPDIPNPPQFLFEEIMAAETKEKFLEAIKRLGFQHSMGKYSGSYNDNIRGATLGEIRGREELGINEVQHGGYVYPRPVKGGLGTQGGVDISPAVQPSGFVSKSTDKGVAKSFARALVPGREYDPKEMGQIHESTVSTSRIFDQEKIEKFIDRFGLKRVQKAFKKGMKSGSLKDIYLNLHKFKKNEHGYESIGMSGDGLSRDEKEITQIWSKNSPYYGGASGVIPNFAGIVGWHKERGAWSLKGDSSALSGFSLYLKEVAEKYPKMVSARQAKEFEDRVNLIREGVSKDIAKVDRETPVGFGRQGARHHRAKDFAYNKERLIPTKGIFIKDLGKHIKQYNKFGYGAEEKIGKYNSLISQGLVPNFADDRTRAQKISDVLSDPANVGIKFKGGALRPRSIKSKNMFQKMWLESYFKTGLEGDYQMLMKMGYDPDELLSLRKFAKKGGKVNILGKGFVPNFSNPLKEAIAREAGAGIPKSQIKVEQSDQLRGPGNPMGLAVTNKRDEPLGVGQGIRRARSMGIDPRLHGAADGYTPNFQNTGGLGPASQMPVSPHQKKLQSSSKVDANTKAIQDNTKAVNRNTTEENTDGGQQASPGGDEEERGMGLMQLFAFQSLLSGANGMLEEFGGTASGATKSMIEIAQAASNVTASFIQAKTITNELFDSLDIKQSEGVGIGGLLLGGESRGKATGAIGAGFSQAKTGFLEGSGVKGRIGGLWKGLTMVGKGFMRFAPIVGQLFTGFTLANEGIKAFGSTLKKLPLVGNLFENWEKGDGIWDLFKSGAERAAEKIEKLAGVSDKASAAMEANSAVQKTQEQITKLEVLGNKRTLKQDKELAESQLTLLKQTKDRQKSISELINSEHLDAATKKELSEASVNASGNLEDFGKILLEVQTKAIRNQITLEVGRSLDKSLRGLEGERSEEFQEGRKAAKTVAAQRIAATFNTDALRQAGETGDKDAIEKAAQELEEQIDEQLQVFGKVLKDTKVKISGKRLVSSSGPGFHQNTSLEEKDVEMKVDAFNSLQMRKLLMDATVKKIKADQKILEKTKQEGVLQSEINEKLIALNTLMDERVHDVKLENMASSTLRQEIAIREKTLLNLGAIDKETAINAAHQRKLNEIAEKQRTTIEAAQTTANKAISKIFFGDTGVFRGIKDKQLDELVRGMGDSGLTEKVAGTKDVNEKKKFLIEALQGANTPGDMLEMMINMSESALKKRALDPKETQTAISAAADARRKIEEAKQVASGATTLAEEQKISDLIGGKTAGGVDALKERLSGRSFGEMAIKERSGRAEFDKTVNDWKEKGLKNVIEDESLSKEALELQREKNLTEAISSSLATEQLKAQSEELLKTYEVQTILKNKIEQKLLQAKIDAEQAFIESQILKDTEKLAEYAKNLNESELKGIQNSNKVNAEKLKQAIINGQLTELAAEQLETEKTSAVKSALLLADKELLLSLNSGLAEESRRALDLDRQANSLRELRLATDRASISSTQLMNESGMRVLTQQTTGLSSTREAAADAVNLGTPQGILAFAQQLEEYNKQIGNATSGTDRLRVKMAELNVSIEDMNADLVSIAIENLRTGIVDLFKDIGTGAKTASEAWKEFGLKLADEILTRVMQRNVDKMISDLTFAFTGEDGMSEAFNMIQNTSALDQNTAAINSQTEVLRSQRAIFSEEITGFNEGGFVRGKPGKDKVPAMLTAGEYVIPKDEVEKMAQGGRLKAFGRGAASFAVQYAVAKAMSGKKTDDSGRPVFDSTKLEATSLGSDISLNRGDPRMSGKFIAQDSALDEYRGHLIDLAQYKTEKKNAKFQQKLGLLKSIYGAVATTGLSMFTEMVGPYIRKGVKAITGWAGKKWQGAKNWAAERFGKYGEGFAEFKNQLSSAGISTDSLSYSNFADSIEKGDAISYGGRMYEPKNEFLSQKGQPQVFRDIGQAPTEKLYSGELQAPRQVDAHVGSYWNDQTANWLQSVDAAQKSRTRRFNAYVAPTVEVDNKALGGTTEGSLPTMLTAGEGFVPAPIAKRIGYNNLNYMNSTGEMPTIQGPGGIDNVGPVGLNEGDFIIRKSSTDKLLNNNPNMMRFAMQNPDGFRRGEQGYYEGGIVGESDLTMPASSLSPQEGRGISRSSLSSEDRQGSSVEKTATGSSETTNNISINVSIDGTGSEKTSETGGAGSYEEERTLSLKIKSAVLDVIRQEKRIGGELS